jgi:hypothetical protein
MIRLLVAFLTIALLPLPAFSGDVSADGGAPEFQVAANENMTWTVRGGWRGPSGFAGSGIEQSFMASNAYALTSLIFREKGDDAVHIEFVGRRLCADTDCAYQSLHHFRIENGVNGNVTSQKSLYVGEEKYATGLAVCTSRSGKLKGVRLLRARIRADGTLERSPTAVQFKRANCSDDRWHQTEECGPRQVIVGLRAVGSAQKGYTGLSVRCGQLNQ